MLALLLAAVLLPVPNTLRPDPELTPGKVRVLSKAEVCGTKWGTDRRFVSEAMKRHVFRAYGIPWADRSLYEVDHKYPRSLGGADDVLNLWPETWAGDWGARRKDRLEQFLSREVCAGRIELKAALRAFDGDWTVSYRRLIGDVARLNREVLP